MHRLLLALFAIIPLALAAQPHSPYIGIYANAAGDDGISDTLYGEIEIFDKTFSLRFVTRQELRQSGRTGHARWLQFYGDWEADKKAQDLDITFYRPSGKAGAPPIPNVEHYNDTDGHIVLLHFKGGKTVRGIFTSRHYPHLPPVLCLDWGHNQNLVFANWSQNRRKNGVMIPARP